MEEPTYKDCKECNSPIPVNSEEQEVGFCYQCECEQELEDV